MKHRVLSRAENILLPGPINNIIKVKGIMMQKASISRHPRRRRGDAVSPIFIVAVFKHLQKKEPLINPLTPKICISRIKYKRCMEIVHLDLNWYLIYKKRYLFCYVFRHR